MRGSIRKRGANWTIILYRGRDESGTKRQKWLGGFKTKRAAEQKLNELLAAMDKGLAVMPSKQRFGDYLRNWLDNHAASIGPRTFEGYNDRAIHVIDGLGHIALSELRPEHIQRYLTQKLKAGRRDGKPGGLSGATVLKHYQLIREALGHAVKNQILAYNPAEAVHPPKIQYKEMMALNEGEVQILLEAFKDTQWLPIVHTALWTGMRRSELLGLRWKDIDLLGASLQVVQVLHGLKDGSLVYTQPKSARSRRSIALSPASCLFLRSYREQQEAIAALLGLELNEGWSVFGRVDGRPRHPSPITTAFSKIAKRAGFHGLRFHDLRHSHASLMLKAGVNVKIVSERLGHSSIVLTLDTYSHLLPGMQEEAALRFDQLAAPAPLEAVPATAD